MPNYDEKTGIHYGMISPNSVMAEVMNDLQISGIDPVYVESKNTFMDKITSVLDEYGFSAGHKDEILEPALDVFNETYTDDGSGIFDYSDKEYTLHNSGDNFGLYVIKSPYYTFCRQCSPCAPGAGDLDAPTEMMVTYHGKRQDCPPYSLKTYCLDKSYFEGEKAPYGVYRVEDDQEVV